MSIVREFANASFTTTAPSPLLPVAIAILAGAVFDTKGGMRTFAARAKLNVPLGKADVK